MPVDCVGGTSQGALMAALYARHASTTHMLPRVKELVGALSSPRHLLTDLTLPVLSIFSGKGVDRILRTVLGDTDIEDLWLVLLRQHEPHVRRTEHAHVRHRVEVRSRVDDHPRDVTPVRDDQTGDLLVDGGYLNAIPVDVLRERMGVETVVVVDVEDNDYTAFRNADPARRRVGRWRLLWERINPPRAGCAGGPGTVHRRGVARERRRRRRERRGIEPATAPSPPPRPPTPPCSTPSPPPRRRVTSRRRGRNTR